MPLGSIHHLALTVSDRAQSEPFYDRVLNFLGYQRVEQNEEFSLWWSAQTGAITIAGMEGAGGGDRPSPGLYHVAFNAETREEVDNLYQLLQEMGATILDPPATYDPYAPGYYAVCFADPDGIRLELVHMPIIA